MNENKIDNTIKLQEEEINLNEINNSKANSNTFTKAENIKKGNINNSPQFIVNKAVNNNNNINNLPSTKQKIEQGFFLSMMNLNGVI